MLPELEEEDLQISVEDLQTLVRTTMPELAELGEEIAALLRQGVPAIVVQKLPFAQFGLKKSKLIFLAFASGIGDPCAVDPYSHKRVWEVSPRNESDVTYIPTITEHNYGADLHTDSSFKQAPEQYVLFYAFHPADDGGGISQLLLADDLLAMLSKNDIGRECLRLLKTISWPFRVPTVFTRNRSETEMEWITAPILSSQPQIRFRYDLITSALQRIPVIPAPEAEWALSHFRQVLRESATLSLALAQDELLVLNNHVVLHGRTPFEDLDRVLLRIRLSTTH